MTSSESSDPDPTDPPTPEISPTAVPPDWCTADGYLYRLLPSIDSDAEGITVELCIPGGAGYSIETYEEIPEELDDTKLINSPFNIYALIAYFKVKNEGVVVTSFDPPLQMRITYTYDAWQGIIEREFDAPRIAYLPWAGDAWAEEWVEFVVVEENIHPPVGEGTDGYIDIYIDELPDPLIGDC